MTRITRRSFLKTTAATAAVAGFPTIVPSSVLGQLAPSKRINVGAIGVGRISRGHDLPGIWQYDDAHIMAVCDLDAGRVKQGIDLVKAFMRRGAESPTTASPAITTSTNCWPTKTLTQW